MALGYHNGQNSYRRSFKILFLFRSSEGAQSGNFLASVVLVGPITLFLSFHPCIWEL